MDEIVYETPRAARRPRFSYLRQRIAVATMALAVLLLGGAIGPVAAQNQEGARSFPGGPWQGECFQAYLDGNYLRAQCHTKSNQLSDTIYDMRDCATHTLINNDGRLTCAPQKLVGMPSNSNVLPFGEWLWYCTDGFIDRNKMLHARCLNANGNWRPVSLPSQNCPGKALVGMKNGQLFCDGRQNGNANFADSALPGPWRATCRDPYFDTGNNLYALCRDAGGKWHPNRLSMGTCAPGAPISAPNGQLRC